MPDSICQVGDNRQSAFRKSAVFFDIPELAGPHKGGRAPKAACPDWGGLEKTFL